MVRFPAWQAALLVVLMAALLPFLAWNGPVQQGNLEVYDWMLGLRPAASEVTPEIVLLAVDDATLARNGTLPLRRNFLAAGLMRLLAEPPKVLAVALTFPEETTKEADEMLGRILAQFPRLALGVEQDAAEEPAPWVMPAPPLHTSNALLGHLHLSSDLDGVVRTVTLRQGDEDAGFWALGAQAAFLAQDGGDLRGYADRLEIGALTIPAQAATSYTVWFRPTGPTGAFQTLSFLRLLDGTLDPHVFAGKIVILGMTATNIGPEYFTPLAKSQPASEIEVQANVVRALLDRDLLQPLDVAWEYALLLAVAGIVVAFAWWRQGRGLLWMAAAGAVLLPAGVFTALAFGWVLPLASLGASFFAVLAFLAVRFSAKSA
jgi:CHASE2 domain-containing sensor protein